MGKSYKIDNMNRIGVFDVFNYLFFVLVAFLTIFPLWNVFIVSITEFRYYVQNPLMIWPEKLYLEAYRYIFSSSDMLRSLGVTVFVTVIGTLFNMFLTITGAYVLSKKKLPGRSLVLTFIIFTMFFDGGLIPYYILIKDMKLVNNLFVLIIPMGINVWYMIIMKNYFGTLPESLEESARMDGANDMLILLRIIIPVSMPIIATFLLFYGVERWNEWWHATLFINNNRLFPIQRLLRDMIVKNLHSQMSAMSSGYMKLSGNKGLVSGENIKMATVIVASVPILMVYPFLQKHFVKGIMIGSIKA